MTQPTCDLCSRPLSDTAYVCDKPCTKKLGEHLLQIVDLAPEVESAIAKLVKFNRGPGGGSGERPLPVDLAAAERAAAIGNTVATWARHVSESRGRPVVPRLPDKPVVAGPLCYHGTALPSLLDSLSLLPCRHGSCAEIRRPRQLVGVTAAAAWLAERDQLEWLRHRREAAEAFGELVGAARDLERLVGRPRDRWYAGPCWAELEDGRRCEEHIYAMPGRRTVRCKCGAEYEAAARKEWLLREAHDALAHASLIAAALSALGMSVAVGTVYSWASRGRIVAHGSDALGRPLYKVGEAIDLLSRGNRRVA